MGMLGHEAHGAGEQCGVQTAHVHAVDEYLSLRHVEQSGHQMQQRRLAAAGRTDHRRRLAGLGGQRDVAQDRFLRAGVAEGGGADLEDALSTHLSYGVGRGRHTAPGVQDLLDALGAHRGPRHHDEQRHRHHHGHHDLHEVGEERRQDADSDLAVGDPVRSRPDHRDRGDVHHGHDEREHQRTQEPRPQGQVPQRRVRTPEAGPLVVVLDERPDHADAGDLLAQHPVHRVESLLHAAEQRGEPAYDQADRQGEDGDDDDQYRGEPGIEAERHHDAADAREGGRDHEGEGREDQRLYLLDVVGGAGDEGRGAEPPYLAGREGLHLVEERGPEVMSETCRGPRAVVDGADAGRDLNEGGAHHDGAQAKDTAVVSRDDAIVDDGGVEGRQKRTAQLCRIWSRTSRARGLL